MARLLCGSSNPANSSQINTDSVYQINNQCKRWFHTAFSKYGKITNLNKTVSRNKNNKNNDITIRKLI